MIRLRDCMDRADGWGRTEGREAYQRLVAAVEALPGVDIFRVSFKGIERVDLSFASETVVEVARRFRKEKGICIVDLNDEESHSEYRLGGLQKGPADIRMAPGNGPVDRASTFPRSSGRVGFCADARIG